MRTTAVKGNPTAQKNLSRLLLKKSEDLAFDEGDVTQDVLFVQKLDQFLEQLHMSRENRTAGTQAAQKLKSKERGDAEMSKPSASTKRPISKKEPDATSTSDSKQVARVVETDALQKQPPAPVTRTPRHSLPTMDTIDSGYRSPVLMSPQKANAQLGSLPMGKVDHADIDRLFEALKKERRKAKHKDAEITMLRRKIKEITEGGTISARGSVSGSTTLTLSSALRTKGEATSQGAQSAATMKTLQDRIVLLSAQLDDERYKNKHLEKEVHKHEAEVLRLKGELSAKESQNLSLADENSRFKKVIKNLKAAVENRRTTKELMEETSLSRRASLTSGDRENESFNMDGDEDRRSSKSLSSNPTISQVISNLSQISPIYARQSHLRNASQTELKRATLHETESPTKSAMMLTEELGNQMLRLVSELRSVKATQEKHLGEAFSITRIDENPVAQRSNDLTQVLQAAVHANALLLSAASPTQSENLYPALQNEHRVLSSPPDVKIENEKLIVVMNNGASLSIEEYLSQFEGDELKRNRV